MMKILIRTGLLLLLLHFCFKLEAQNQNSDTVVVYPLAPKEVVSTVYSVNVNGINVPVDKYSSVRTGINRQIGVAAFAFAGTAVVKISMSVNVPAGYVLSPKAFNINPTVSGKDITFTLTTPRKLILHYGGREGLSNSGGLTEKLFLFADPLEDNPPKPTDADVIDLASYSPDNQGNTFVTTKIQSAIDAAAASPTKKTVYVGAGTYNVDNQIKLKSGVKLYLAPGSLIRATTVNFGQIGLIGATNATNIKLFGRGMLHGNGNYFRNQGVGYYSPMGFEAIGCTNVTVEDIILRDMNPYTVQTDACSKVRYYNTKSFTEEEPSTLNGMNINNGTTDFVADNVLTYASDDVFADTWGGSMHDHTLKNSVLWSTGTGSINLSNPYTSETKNLTFENNYIISDERTFSIMCSLYGEPAGPKQTPNMHHFYFKNIYAEFPAVQMFWMQANGWDDSDNGYVHDIYFSNIFMGGYGKGDAYGPNGASVSGNIQKVSFNNFYVAGGLQTNTTQAKFNFLGNPVTTSNFTFTNTEATVVSISASDMYAGFIGSNTGKFTVSRTGSTANELEIKYKIRGTAINGVDYNAIDTMVTIPAGQSSADIVITPKNISNPVLKTVFLSLDNLNLSTAWMLGADYHAVVVISAVAATSTGSLKNESFKFSVYPNPSGNDIHLTYDLPAPGKVGIAVFDASGKEMYQLADANQGIGDHSVTLNISNYDPGVYFVQLKVNDFADVRKFIKT